MAPRKRRAEWGAVTKKSGRWLARYTGPDGRRHTPGCSFATKMDAQGWLAHERRLIDTDRWTPPKVRKAKAKESDITVGQWLEQYHALLQKRNNPPRKSTMQTYQRTVRVRILEPTTPGADCPDVTRLKDIPLAKLTKQDVYRWWDGLQECFPDDGRVTNQKAYVRLRAALDEAVRRELVPENPVEIPEAAKKVKPQEKYLMKDWEVQALIDAVPERYKVVTSLVLRHGLRIGEALALEVGDVHICRTGGGEVARVTVSIRQNAQRINDDTNHARMVVQPPKTKAGARTVPIMSVDVPLFVAHLEQCAPGVTTEVETDDGVKRLSLLTTTANGNILLDTSYRSVLNRAKKEAGTSPRITPHCGRNWLITRLAEQGAHLKEIGTLLGQEDVSTILNVYMKARAERTVEMMDAVNNSLEAKK